MSTDQRTDDELNKVIAEWCGWVNHKKDPLWWVSPIKDEGGNVQYCMTPPNYCRDLNTVHKAEKKLLGDIGNTWDRYCDRLGGSLYHCAHATALQRAEALVKVIEEGRK